jgi:putative glutamine amidotransferase
MKRLGITQRVEECANYKERRDCLDQRWYVFANHLGYVPIPLPNVSAIQVPELCKSLKLHAVLFSGGNSIANLEPHASNIAPERDQFELALLKHLIHTSIPTIGICRGMQIINLYFGGKLCKIDNHVAVNHAIIKNDNTYELPDIVNSYHNWGIKPIDLADCLTPICCDQQGYIEGYVANKHRILGIMWHPERENPHSTIDINLIRNFLS